MSRSCHNATFSNAASMFERTSLAKPQICSQLTGLRLWGMAELPRCPSLKGSSASRTSVRCKCRISSAIRLRSEEHTSELQSRLHLVCRLLLEKKKRDSYLLCSACVPVHDLC